MYDISQKRINAAARIKYADWIKSGYKVRVSAPYWVDDEVVRVSIYAKKPGEKGDLSFGANFYYKDGVIR